MTKRETSTTKVWVDASVADMPAHIQALLTEEREIYDMLKAQKAKVVAALRECMAVKGGKVIVGTTYTRWGQWQIVLDDAPSAKPAKASGRATLADFLEAQQAGGHNA